MTVKRKRILPVLLTLFLLAGCGQQAPPSEYTVGAESLPALAVSENGEFLEETDPETEETSYTYSGLASGEKAAAFSRVLRRRGERPGAAPSPSRS